MSDEGLEKLEALAASAEKAGMSIYGLEWDGAKLAKELRDIAALLAAGTTTPEEEARAIIAGTDAVRSAGTEAREGEKQGWCLACKRLITFDQVKQAPPPGNEVQKIHWVGSKWCGPIVDDRPSPAANTYTDDEGNVFHAMTAREYAEEWRKWQKMLPKWPVGTEGLRAWLHHHGTCALLGGSTDPYTLMPTRCTCGLDAALRGEGKK